MVDRRLVYALVGHKGSILLACTYFILYTKYNFVCLKFEMDGLQQLSSQLCSAQGEYHFMNQILCVYSRKGNENLDAISSIHKIMTNGDLKEEGFGNVFILWVESRWVWFCNRENT